MTQEYSRTQRVGDYLKRELSLLIQQELRDPRVGMVNVNDVEVSRDLSHAKVFTTFVGERGVEAETEALKVLNGAAGFLRSRIASSNHMRTTPRLHFVLDTSIRRGAHLTALIDQAIAADHHLHDAANP